MVVQAAPKTQPGGVQGALFNESYHPPFVPTLVNKPPSARDNMDAFAPSINRSVFINGNMPKSKKNALSTEDRQILKSGVRKELNH